MKSTDNGFISLMAIWIIALMSVITAEFVLSVRNEVNTLNNEKSSTKAFYAAEAGGAAALKAIYDGALDEIYKGGEKVRPQDNDKAFTPVWRLNTEMAPVAYGDAYYRVKIGNESGRININEADNSLLSILSMGIGLPEGDVLVLKDSIQDWRDRDDFFRLNGAESEYYRSLSKPYSCKNNYFASVDELLLVRGMKRDLFYKHFLPEMLSVIEIYAVDIKRSDIQTYLTLENKETDDGIQQFLTVSGREKAKKANDYDYNKININAASPSLLIALPRMNEKIVSDIIEFRKNADFTSPEELSAITGPEIFSFIKDYIHFNKNNFYEIIVDAWALDGSGRQRIKWTVYIENKGNKKKVKILEKIINPDIYSGLEYYDYNRR